MALQDDGKIVVAGAAEERILPLLATTPMDLLMRLFRDGIATF
jgi:hypothetical protein